MNILLLGAGGREHALAWKLAQSRAIAQDGGALWAAPGNPGIARHARLAVLDAADHAGVAQFCAQHAIGLVVVGPEAPLVDGLADSLRAHGIAVFGPSQAAARLEGSKRFTKQLCDRAGIPTAGYAAVGSVAAGQAALGRFGPPYVLKADGLAGGKGVVIAETRAQAETALAELLGGQVDAASRRAGAGAGAGAGVVIEEFMRGEEVSFFALTDGAAILPFGSAQDHKRAFDGDTGPNTGGMGAYSPASILTPELRDEVMRRIIAPTVHRLAQDGTPYSGVLYAGLMLTAQGPRLIEYNCRFGDPECQALMLRFEGDLADYLLACAEGRLAELAPARFTQACALTVVMAARGYPANPETGGAIAGIELAEASGAQVFHAATALGAAGGLVAMGGRVLGVTAAGADVARAHTRAYAAVAAIDFPSGFFRRDIGWRELARSQA